ncbi:acyltransferase [Prauserella muralis]|uniref:Uncharacterized protein n=1 Tax=Prauserella muralis TaxID=588067 RepID=A0A2V4B375_9PSEU|nr:acyltransferase [Prauserella muralis]PXY27848.1 hypothetical protein BAY60_15900 [Prauserella muralis]TWE22384.1 sugar O-acyltransferase (sialic acid O-acetyltransferase NeuD family) [Prauserella muralis]
MSDGTLGVAPIHIVGAGGLGREVFDALFQNGVTAADVVFADDHLAAGEVHGAVVRRLADTVGGSYVVAVADPAGRRRLRRRMESMGSTPMAVVHPRAVIAHDVVVWPGCVVLANAFISTGVRLEPHTQVHSNATVGHDTIVHEYTTVLPGANLAGNVVLERDVTVGSNACVLSGVHVGAGTFIGAGAVATKTHPAGRLLTRVPAR